VFNLSPIWADQGQPLVKIGTPQPARFRSDCSSGVALPASALESLVLPSRVADYSQQFAAWNLIISLASFGLGLSTLIFLYNIA